MPRRPSKPLERWLKDGRPPRFDISLDNRSVSLLRSLPHYRGWNQACGCHLLEARDGSLVWAALQTRQVRSKPPKDNNRKNRKGCSKKIDPAPRIRKINLQEVVRRAVRQPMFSIPLRITRMSVIPASSPLPPERGTVPLPTVFSDGEACITKDHVLPGEFQG